MIQRIQTLYLLGIIILMILVQVMPIASSSNLVLNITNVTNLNDYSILDTFLFTRLTSFAIILLATLIIFLFKNRKLQIKLGNLLLGFQLVLIALIIFQIKNFISNYVDFELNKFPHLHLGSYFPLLSLLFTLLAQNAIKKDEALVRSVDRLR